MGSMRKALGTMAKAGKDAPTELRKTFDTIKNAKTPSEATAAAIELFGVKAGPDMAAALREGRFDVEGILDTIAGGSDTVLGAADDTNDFAEQWLMFKNKVAVAVAPVAERLFSAVGEGMAVLTEHAPEILAFLQAHSGRPWTASHRRPRTSARRWRPPSVVSFRRPPRSARPWPASGPCSLTSAGSSARPLPRSGQPSRSSRQ